jgi:HEAT repeat protein
LGISLIGPEARSAVPELLAFLKDPDKLLRCSAAGALGKLRADLKTVVPALVEALKDKESDVRYCAAVAIEDIGTEARDAVPALIKALKDPDDSVRSAAIGAIEGIGEAAAEATPLLVDMIKAGAEGEGLLAARALGKMGGRAVGPLLEALAKEAETDEVRVRLVGALGRIGKPAVQDLAKILSAPEAKVRQAAAMALGRIGPDARDALPALESAAGDKDKLVSTFAKIAIEKIRKATGPGEEGEREKD